MKPATCSATRFCPKSLRVSTPSSSTRPAPGPKRRPARWPTARVPRIAAVSCNPVTFARDAKILCDAGYRLQWVQMVDQFRFSPHVELAAAFAR